MTEFIKEALPFILIGLSLGIFFGAYSIKHKKKKDENEWDFSAMGPLFGVAIGVAVGTVNESIGAGLGAGIGMFIGSIIEFIAAKLN